MEWKLEIKDSGFVPQNRKPTEGNAWYKTGSTYYEVPASPGYVQNEDKNWANLILQGFAQIVPAVWRRHIIYIQL